MTLKPQLRSWREIIAPRAKTSPAPDQMDRCSVCITTGMPTTSRRLLPVDKPGEAIQSFYGEVLSPSDIGCLLALLTQGHLEVRMNRDTRDIELIPDAKAEPFVKQVFAVPNTVSG